MMGVFSALVAFALGVVVGLLFHGSTNANEEGPGAGTESSSPKDQLVLDLPLRQSPGYLGFISFADPDRSEIRMRFNADCLEGLARRFERLKIEISLQDHVSKQTHVLSTMSSSVLYTFDFPAMPPPTDIPHKVWGIGKEGGVELVYSGGLGQGAR